MNDGYAGSGVASVVWRRRTDDSQRESVVSPHDRQTNDGYAGCAYRDPSFRSGVAWPTTPDENPTSENQQTMRAREERRAANRAAWRARPDYQPARGYSRPPFDAGNIASVTHGFCSPRLYGIMINTTGATLTWAEWAELLRRLETSPDPWHRDRLADDVRRVLAGPCDLCGSTACPEKPDL